MKRISYFLLTFCFIALLGSCKKDAISEVLIISPEKIASFAGKDWNTISSEFKNKKDYKYSLLNNGNVLAAISLPAKDPDAPAMNYTLLFNVNQQNRVSSVSLQTIDLLNIEMGNNLFLYYYEKAMSRMEGVFYTSAINNYDQQVNIPVEVLVAQLRNFNCEQASLSYHNPTMVMEAGFYQGLFSFNIFAP